MGVLTLFLHILQEQRLTNYSGHQHSLTGLQLPSPINFKFFVFDISLEVSFGCIFWILKLFCWYKLPKWWNSNGALMTQTVICGNLLWWYIYLILEQMPVQTQKIVE